MSRYFTSSILIAAVYALLGYYWGGFDIEHVLLASAIVIIAGILPDVDGSDEMPTREVAGLLAAVSPLVFLELFPGISQGSLIRVALIIICCYILTRLIIFRGLKLIFSPRGMIHSIPSSIISFQLTYLLFWELPLYSRLFISMAAFVGFFFHLLLEAYLEFDLIGRASGKHTTGAGTLKFFGRSWLSNATVYGTMLILGWIIVKDIYPDLGVSAKLTY